MKDFTINKGFCEGMVIGDLFTPTDDVSICTVRVRDARIRPDTKQQTISYIQFTAFDEVAKSLREIDIKDKVIYIEYFISTSKKTDENGISKFYKNRIIQNFFIFEKPEDAKLIPYINLGFAQGEFVSIKKATKSTGIYFLTIKLTTNDNGKIKTYYPQFTIYGDKFAELFNKYNSGDLISITYRIETEKKNIDGSEEFFTDYIVTEVK